MEIRIQSCEARDYTQVAAYIKKQGGVPKPFVDKSDYYRRGGKNRVLGLWNNFIEMLNAPLDDTENNGVVITVQDDVRPSDTFVEACREIVKFMPRRCLLGGMLMNTTARALEKWENDGKPVVFQWELIPAQNMFLPVETVREFNEWLTQFEESVPRGKEGGVWGDDKTLYQFALAKKVPIYGIMPALVNHEGIISTLGSNWKYKDRTRGALLFDKDFDFGKVNWRKEFNRYG